MKIRDTLKGRGKWAAAAGFLLILLFVQTMMSLPVRDETRPAPDKLISKNVPPTVSENTADRSLPAYSGTPVPDRQAAAPLPPLGDRVIKNATITVKIKRHGFDRANDKAIFIAGANGGYVVGSNSSMDSGPVTGTITIRVPAGAFEKAVTDLRRLGKVRALNISGQDVGQEYVDLESRLRHWRAQESILLGLMEKAETITDSITVQNQLSAVQQQIEEITGRLNYLKAQTELSTIQLTITEATVIPAATRWGFNDALTHAAHAFVDTINGAIVIAGYLLPLALLGALVYMVALLLRKRFSGAM